MAAIANPTFQKANLGLPNANTPLIVGVTPSQITQAWMMFFLQLNNAIAGNGAALEGALQGIDDVADLRSQTVSSLTAQIVYVAGYYAEGDGGGGIFFQSNVSTPDDGGSVIVDASGRHWVRETGGGPFSVLWWGAQSTPGILTFDNSLAFQAALNYCEGLGGGMVTVPVGIYYFTGVLSVPSNCGLVGLMGGRGGDYFDPRVTVVGPMLLVTDQVNPFITLQGAVQTATDLTGGAYADGLMFFWPSQVTFTASTPVVYPPAIRAFKGAYMRRLNMINPYQGIQLLGGRSYIEDFSCGALQNAISIDSTYDYVYINNVQISVQYEYWPLGATYTAEPLDVWVKANRVNISIARCDAFKISNVGMLWGQIGFQFIDSAASQPGGTLNSYGTVIGCDIDTLVQGIEATSTNTSGGGVQFIGLNSGCTGFSVVTNTGGSNPPQILWSGGANRSAGLGSGTTMSLGVAASVMCRDVTNFTPFGSMAAIQPAAPASGVAQENFFPWVVQVFVEGSSISHVAINGVLVGAFTGSVMVYTLNPGDTLTVTYTGTIATVWFGL